MTPTELKAWIRGFEQGRDGGPPDEEDWATIREHIAGLTPEPMPSTVTTPFPFPLSIPRVSELGPLPALPSATFGSDSLMQTLRQRANATVTPLKPRGSA
jgi:hypothetical protein